MPPGMSIKSAIPLVLFMVTVGLFAFTFMSFLKQVLNAMKDTTVYNDTTDSFPDDSLEEKVFRKGKSAHIALIIAGSVAALSAIAVIVISATSLKTYVLWLTILLPLVTAGLFVWAAIELFSVTGELSDIVDPSTGKMASADGFSDEQFAGIYQSYRLVAMCTVLLVCLSVISGVVIFMSKRTKEELTLLVTTTK